MSLSKPKVCPVCREGSVKRGKVLLIESDSFYKCDSCHSEFHKQDGKYILKNVPNNQRWKPYEEKLLSFEEINRINEGGISDAEIAQQKTEDEERLRKQEEDDRKRMINELISGTPENFLLRFKKILGMEEDGNFELAVRAKSKDEVNQYVKHLGQLQKELKQLKKEISVKKKQIKSDYDNQKSDVNAEAAIYGSSRDMVSIRTREKQSLDRQRDLEFELHDEIIKQIDSSILSLDKGKLEIQNQWMGLKIGDAGNTKKKTAAAKSVDKNVSELKLEDIIKELNSLIGLDNVKSEVQELTDFLKIQQVRKSRNLPTPALSLHVVFYGNPGTGKTTVARMLAKIYMAMGILSKGHLVETDRSGLVAGYVGQTALKVTEIVNQSLGGILFIDEAYSLTDNDEGGYGSEAIDTLIKTMEDHRDDLAVVIAGYTGKMEGFLSSNPGLKSRFNRFWEFKDYVPPELFKIFLTLCSAGQFKLSTPAMKTLAILLQQAYDQRDDTFGNGRLVRNVYEATISNQASRLISKKDLSDDELRTIETEDIPKDIASLRMT